MKRLLSHRWVIGVAAIILTLAIGAGAWAATGTGSGADDAVCPALGQNAGGSAGVSPGMGLRGLGGMMRGLGGDADLDQLRERMQERREEMMKYRDGILDLVREKMSAEDQAKLDGLLETAKNQREEVKKATEALRDTMKQIRDLIKQYVPANEAASGGA